MSMNDYVYQLKRQSVSLLALAEDTRTQLDSDVISESPRDDHLHLVKRLMQEVSMKFDVITKLGYTVINMDNGITFVLDGVAISVKRGTTEIDYIDTPKENYYKIQQYLDKVK